VEHLNTTPLQRQALRNDGFVNITPLAADALKALVVSTAQISIYKFRIYKANS
jgi:hypothetical protein